MSTVRSEVAPELADRPAFALFEGFAASSVLAAFEMAGLLSLLEADGISRSVIADREADEAALLRASLRYLEQRGLVTAARDVYTLTPYGRAVVGDKGYLVWLVGGYGEPLRRLDAFLGQGKRYGVDYVRDGKWVAGGAALLGAKDVVPHAMALLAETEFGVVLDIGCGNARFLINTCRRFGARGVGIDISPEACADARRAVKEAGLVDRVSIIETDAADLGGIAALAEADLVVTFFLLHEILAQGHDVLAGYLAELARRLPTGAHLLIAEVEPPVHNGGGPERFTPEFTYVHALMRQTLLPAEGWVQVLERSGFTVRKVAHGDMPGGILLLCQTAS